MEFNYAIHKKEFPSLNFDAELSDKGEEFKKAFEEECGKMAGRLKEEKSKYPVFKPNYSQYLIVTGLPIVEEEKYEKFYKVITDVMVKQNVIVPKESITIPKDEKSCTRGFMIIKAQNEKDAFEIVEKMSAIKLGKNSLKAILLDDFDGRLEASQTPLPEIDNLVLQMYKNKFNQDQLLSVNQAQKDVSQFELSIDPKYFNLKLTKDLSKLITLENGFNIHWSTKGSFLAMAKKNYVILYGTNDMIEIRKFCHKNVEGYIISPDEKMIVTYSIKQEGSDKGSLEVVKVWDIFGETEVRRFNGAGEKPSHIKWSYDGKLLCFMRKDLLSIYEAPDMKMMMDLGSNRTSIKAEKISDFIWSPFANKLFLIYKIGDITKMQIRELPSRLDIVTKSYSNVNSCLMKWHPKDLVIATLISFHAQKKNTQIDDSIAIINFQSKVALNFEIHFSKIFDFEFQPCSNGLLAMTVCDNNQKNQFKVFKGHRIVEKAIEYNAIFSGTSEGEVHWNKMGTFVASSYCKGQYDSELVLYCVENDIVKQYERIKVDFQDFSWSSSGTLFALRKKEDFGIYSVDGTQLISKKIISTNLEWRPYEIIATQEEKDEAIANKETLMKQYKAQYDKAQAELKAKKEKKYEEFYAKFIAPKVKAYDENREAREKLLGRKEFNSALYDVVEYVDNEKIIESKLIKE